MDQSRDNTRSAPASRAAANTSGGGISHPAVTSFQFNKENNEEEIPVQGQFVSSQQPVQLYTDVVLRAQRAAVLAATGSGPDILTANKTAQAALAADADKANKTLTPYFTSMGVESEFAQQQQLQGPPLKNALTTAHVIVTQQGGYALYPHLKFLLETDAGAALEFVTPPLLAPLREEQAQPVVAGALGNDAIVAENDRKEEANEKAIADVIPDPAWEKDVRKGIETTLRNISSAGEKSVRTIITEINAAFSLALPVPADPIDKINYGNIDKSGADSFTNVQLNYMTTLQHFMEVNRGEDGKQGDSFTEQIYKLALDGEDDNSYVYALCQKLREIPSMLVDETFSILLHNDEHPAAEPDEGYGIEANKALVAKAKAKPAIRKTLSNTASHIKDGATLWLKASFDQILAGVPSDAYREVYDMMKVLAKKKPSILAVLKATPQVTALKEFHAAGTINTFLTEQLNKLDTLNSIDKQHENESDIDKKPAEQKTISDDRREIIGGRPDTYAPADEEINGDEQPLFLVETRHTTSYLGLTKADAYKPPKKAAAKVAAAPVVALPVAVPQQAAVPQQVVAPQQAGVPQQAGIPQQAAAPIAAVPPGIAPQQADDDI